MANKIRRNRAFYVVAALVAVVLGLSSRAFAGRLPELLATYAGDTLWALTAFLGIGLLFPRWSTMHVGLMAFLFAVLIELSQLYHSPWIDQLRHTRVGGLILGYAFLWSDILCYAAGVGIGCVLEILIYRQYRFKQA